ncbi:MAG: SAM-dependent methyltransferase [Alphaproteobacteria bacterium]|nr:MAG: SAM-dependent methyltransferase [Alphaproteobacteria bacterium]
MTIIAYFIYVILQISLLPIGLIGVIWVGYRQVWISRKLGLSQTAVEVINGRWTMDVFNIRKDDAARRLASVLPNNSTTGLWLALFPLYVLHLLSGRNLLYPRIPGRGDETIADLMIARTILFDTLIEEHIETAEQFVILGAGLDTRAYGPLAGPGLSMFELDQSATQRMKRQRLEQAHIPSDHVRFIEVDFSDARWIDGLVDAGFNPSLKTVFLWEGVTLYLDQEDVINTLAAVKSVAAPGSALLVDIYAESFLKLAKKGAMAKTLDATGESLGFGLDFATAHQLALDSFLQSQNLQPGASMFMGSNGKKGPFVVIAEVLL